MRGMKCEAARDAAMAWHGEITRLGIPISMAILAELAHVYAAQQIL